MEYGTIEREIYIEASPEVVFEVVSRPDHLQQWWPEEAHYEPVPGSTGEIVFGERVAGGTVVPFSVVDPQPPPPFSFRWTQPAGHPAAAGHSPTSPLALTPPAPASLSKVP